ncbi:MAG: ABC transporter substrate-binding protein, partial [Chloroflexota bacterium]|nr:ABC transporter substrate-binding protein [Chloroflexota bacterium]
MMPHRDETVARVLSLTMDRRISRRGVLRRAAALGVSVPLTGALLATQGQLRPAFAQEGSPAAAPPSGDPIKIGASISTTGSNGRTGLYQKEAYELWMNQKNAAGGVLGRPVEMVIYDDQSDPATGARLYE